MRWQCKNTNVMIHSKKCNPKHESRNLGDGNGHNRSYYYVWMPYSSKIWYVQGHETLEKLQNVIPIVPRANIWMAQ